MRLRSLNFLTVVFNYVVYVRSEMYSAVVSMMPLIETQAEVSSLLKQYTEINLDKKKMQGLKGHIKIFEMEQDFAKQDGLAYLANPINAFRIIKRLTIDLDIIENTILTKTGVLEEIKETMKFPSPEDLKGASDGLMRLQKTYRLNITELAFGVLKTSSSLPMSSSDCYYLGLHFYKDQYDLVLLITGAWWLLEALYKFKADDAYIYNITDADILTHLFNVYSSIDDESACAEWYENIISPKPERYKWLVKRQRERLSFKYLQELEKVDKKVNSFKNQPLNKTRDKKEQIALESLKYEHFCREGQIMIPKKQKTLKCFYAHGPHASLKISPLKAEVLHHKPDLMMFHDLVTDDEIETIINASIPIIRRSEIENTKTKQTYHGKSDGRVSQDCVLLDKDAHIEERLNKRVSAITGLGLSSADGLNVINYGIGGHFVLHLDAMKHVQQRRRNRIATVIFYFSNVTLGGATVFPELDLTVFPKKGAALFFMNLLPSGNRDPLTMHGACPVLLGIKWIANKWFYEEGQEYLRPCDLTPD